MTEYINVGLIKTKDPKAHPHDPRSVIEEWSNGLTVRAHFASMAMQALFSNNTAVEAFAENASNRSEIVVAAVGIADLLIAELAK